MDIERIKEIRLKQDGLSKTLGMEFLSTDDPDTCQAKMKVDERNRQVFGFLSGGATLALAENLTGVGSMALCPNKICVGVNVSGSHVRLCSKATPLQPLHAYYIRARHCTSGMWKFAMKRASLFRRLRLQTL